MKDAIALSDSSEVKLNGHEKNGKSNWSCVYRTIKNAPTDRQLNFSCFLRAERDNTRLNINVFAYDDQNNLADSWIDEAFVDRKKWNQFSKTYVAPKGTTQFRICVVDESKNAAFVRRFSCACGWAERAAFGKGKRGGIRFR